MTGVRLAALVGLLLASRPESALGIGAGTGTAASAAAARDTAASTSAASLPRFGGRLESNGTVRFDHGSPVQHPQARLDFYLEDRIAPGLRWRVSAIGTWGGTVLDPSGPGLVDLGRALQNVDPSLELDEAYLDWRGETVDLRLGKQKFSWGRLDLVQPNDLLSPRRYLDPFRTDEIDGKVAPPALSASWYFPETWRARLPDELRLSFAWVPIFVPWRYPELDERWFAPTGRISNPVPLERISLPGGAGGKAAPVQCPCTVTLDETAGNSPAPARQLDESTFGVRLAGRTAVVDWAAVFFDGYDPAAAFTATISDVELVAPPAGQRVRAATGRLDLRTAYERMQSAGLDAASTLGSWTLRFEGAFKFRRPYPRALSTLPQEIASDPERVAKLLAGGSETLDSFARRDAVEWGASADTVWNGFLPLLELYQVVLLRNDQPLLVRDVDTRLAATLRRRWLADRLEAQASLIWGVEAGYELGRAQLTYALTDALQLRLGVLAIAGSRSSLIGQFKRNGEAFARLRWSF